jgi:hypothetical protein
MKDLAVEPASAAPSVHEWTEAEGFGDWLEVELQDLYA